MACNLPYIGIGGGTSRKTSGAGRNLLRRAAGKGVKAGPVGLREKKEVGGQAVPDQRMGDVQAVPDLGSAYLLD